MEKLLRLGDVEKVVGFSKASIYKFMEDKGFPRPIKIGKSSRWKLSEVLEWIERQTVRG